MMLIMILFYNLTSANHNNINSNNDDIVNFYPATRASTNSISSLLLSSWTSLVQGMENLSSVTLTTSTTGNKSGR